MRRNVNKWREAIASHIRACTKCKGVDTPVPLYACRINYRQHSVRPQCTQLQPWFTWFLFITPRLQRIKNPHVIWSFHRQKGGFWKSSRALHWMNYVLWEMAVLHVENFALVRPKVLLNSKSIENIIKDNFILTWFLHHFEFLHCLCTLSSLKRRNVHSLRSSVVYCRAILYSQ